MYKKSTAVFTTLLMLVLVIAAMAWGAWKGWDGERAQLDSQLGGLEDMLEARQEVASNILTVAARHLGQEDAQFKALQANLAAMRTGSISMRSQGNARMEQAASSVLDTLRATPSVQADERDSMYVESMLPQALEQSARLTDQTAYNTLAIDYNQRKASSLSGRLATLLGVQDAAVFTLGEGTP